MSGRLGVIGVFILGVLAGCASEAVEEPANDEASNLGEAGSVRGVPDTFNHNLIMTDELFLNTTWVSEEEVQALFENTPWGLRSWLATYKVGDELVSHAVVRLAKENGFNPLVLVGRMQTENGLLSKQFRTPPRHALGCNQKVPSDASFDRQLNCAARTFHDRFEDAKNGRNNFPVGEPNTTLDGVSVRPENIATSTFYSYTPVDGSKTHNGTWLAWFGIHRVGVHFERLRQAR